MASDQPPNQATRWEPIESHTLTAEKGPSGLWFVTGSMHRGLLVTGRTLGDALSRVEDVWTKLRQADREQPAGRGDA